MAGRERKGVRERVLCVNYPARHPQVASVAVRNRDGQWVLLVGPRCCTIPQLNERILGVIRRHPGYVRQGQNEGFVCRDLEQATDFQFEMVSSYMECVRKLAILSAHNAERAAAERGGAGGRAVRAE